MSVDGAEKMTLEIERSGLIRCGHGITRRWLIRMRWREYAVESRSTHEWLHSHEKKSQLALFVFRDINQYATVNYRSTLQSSV